MLHHRSFAAFALLCLVGCAGSESPTPVPETDSGGGRDTSPEVSPPDDVEDTPDLPERPDIPVQPDVPVVPDVTPDVPAETGPDVFDCEPEELGDECRPTAVYCADERTRAFCSRCGVVLNTEACTGRNICDESSGNAVCRPCEGAECPANIDCIANTRTCADFRTVQVCGADGTVTTTQPCSVGRRCFDGSCGPEGQQTSAACEVNRDPVRGCAGDLCVCGTDYVAASGTAGCSGAMESGYCTTRGCTENRCNTDTEVCVDFGISGQWGGNDFCVTKETCAVRNRSCGSRAGMVCQELPGRRGPDAPVAWELACWNTGLRAIGESCDSNNDCAGGECLTRDVNGVTVSYCSMPCGADGGCPSYASCVLDPADNTGYQCLANATVGDCPRLETEPLRIRPRTNLERFGGGAVSVCWFAR